MGTIIGGYIGTAIGIHSPIPYEAPGSFLGWRALHMGLMLEGKRPKDQTTWQFRA